MPYKDKNSIKNKEKIKLTKQKYYQQNKEKILKQRKKYRIDNKELIAHKRKKYYNKNKNKIIKQRINYERIKLKNNIKLKLIKNIRNRLHQALKNKQKAGSAIRDLGCSIEKFTLWIEMQWWEGMSWENYGKWHLDHIKALSNFNLENRDELLIACNFKNIQPMWAEDNLRKGNR